MRAHPHLPQHGAHGSRHAPIAPKRTPTAHGPRRTALPSSHAKLRHPFLLLLARFLCAAHTHLRRCMKAFTKKEYIYANIAILEFLLWTCDRLSVQRGWLSRQVTCTQPLPSHALSAGSRGRSDTAAVCMPPHALPPLASWTCTGLRRKHICAAHTHKHTCSTPHMNDLAGERLRRRRPQPAPPRAAPRYGEAAAGDRATDTPRTRLPPPSAHSVSSIRLHEVSRDHRAPFMHVCSSSICSSSSQPSPLTPHSSTPHPD